MNCIDTSKMSDCEFFSQTMESHPFTCKECSFAFNSQKNLDEHYYTHYGCMIKIYIKKDSNGDPYVSKIIKNFKPTPILIK